MHNFVIEKLPRVNRGIMEVNYTVYLYKVSTNKDLKQDGSSELGEK